MALGNLIKVVRISKSHNLLLKPFFTIFSVLYTVDLQISDYIVKM